MIINFIHTFARKTKSFWYTHRCFSTHAVKMLIQVIGIALAEINVCITNIFACRTNSSYRGVIV